MNAMRFLLNIIMLWSILFIATACDKYLEVSPKSSLSEEEIFSSATGFHQVLSGVYSQMASQNIYGDRLSMGFVSALANSYTISSSSSPFVETQKLNFASAEVQAHCAAVWKASYTAIATLNNLLVNLDRKKQLLTDQDYTLIKGEALGLRAYLHFDLLRLFGKAYESGKAEKAIPYEISMDEYANVPVTGEKVVELALNDISDAAALLEGTDPVRSGTLNRRIKMNYYGVKALEARIRLYSGDREGAFTAAKQVIDSEKFLFVTAADVGSEGDFKDRVFLTEQVFALRIRGMESWVNTYFKTGGDPSFRLSRSMNDFGTLYETALGGTTDYRYLYLTESVGSGMSVSSKFWQSSLTILDSARTDQLMPLLRLSEMYYILAETAPDPEEGLSYLNTVRVNRGVGMLNLPTVTAEYVRKALTAEYQKEFYAEGQLFFYYKRIQATTMQFMTASDPAIVPEQYVLPIPMDEQEFNPNY